MCLIRDGGWYGEISEGIAQGPLESQGWWSEAGCQEIPASKKSVGILHWCTSGTNAPFFK